MSIYSGLSSAQHFRVYPYIDRAFRLEEQSKYNAAIAQIEKASELAPEHLPFHRYALRLGYKANIDAKKLQTLINALPKEESQIEMFKHRLDVVKDSEPLDIYEFDILSQGLTHSQIAQMYLTHLYALEQRYGVDKALSWSHSQPSVYKNNAVYRYEAYKWFEKQQYHRVPSLIGTLINSKQYNLEDSRYLLLSLIYLDRDKEAYQWVQQEDLAELEVLYLRSSAARLIANKSLSKAKIKLRSLKDIAVLTPMEKAQLSYIMARD